jgi:hypothetical protein
LKAKTLQDTLVKNQYNGIYICYEQTPETFTENEKLMSNKCPLQKPRNG